MKKTLIILAALVAVSASAAPVVGPNSERINGWPTRIIVAGRPVDSPTVAMCEAQGYTLASQTQLDAWAAEAEAAAALAAEAAAVSLAESLDTQIDASQLKALLLSAVEALPESEQAELPTFFPAWRPGAAYAVSNKLQFASQLYRVIQPHTSQMDWTPDVAVSLFAAIQPPGVIAEWVQPDSTNPYQTGDQVTHNGQTWTSTADNNVWAPGVYGWEETP